MKRYVFRRTDDNNNEAAAGGLGTTMSIAPAVISRETKVKYIVKLLAKKGECCS